VWRQPTTTSLDGPRHFYEDIGEDVPQGAARMISPPELAYEPPGDVALMVDSFGLGEAPSDAWKLVYDCYVRGRISIESDDETGRIVKGADGVLRPTWVIDTELAGFGGDAQVAHDEPDWSGADNVGD
jgi:hypothetical protein